MDAAELAELFERERPYLRRLAYSTLGSLTEADDVVQDAWIKLQRSDVGAIENLQAWLARVTGRLALDQLTSARARRERYTGNWLPEPAVGQDDPADRVTQDERVTTALLVVLEALTPAERTAFVLHEVFGMPAAEVGEVVGRSPVAVRQLISRARRHVRERTPRFPPTPDEHARVVLAFSAAWRAGELGALLSVLDPDVTFTGDGGGKAVAVLHPVLGARAVAEMLTGWAISAHARPAGTRGSGAIVAVNGRPGLVIADGPEMAVFSFTIDDGRIVAIHAVRNPDKLRNVPPPGEEDWFG
ncbi:RNA polymerase sigma factor SigJ [Nocardia sp. NPDC088792]|uniref:RNA polymerase sigma factor SigJ n=1 Tax=Nocardia sp. NPDC088792 TaxID=3364332 RepID=UPI003816CA3B